MLLKFLQKINVELQQKGHVVFESTYCSENLVIIKNEFKNFDYVSFRDIKFRNLILNDTHRFFKTYSENVIFDFIEFVPNFLELVSNYSSILYQKVDYLILSYSQLNIQKYNLNQLQYLSPQIDLYLKLKKIQYLDENFILNIDDQGENLINYKNQLSSILNDFISKEIHEKNLKNIKDLLVLISGEVGKPLNINSLAKKLSLTQPTVDKFIQLLVYFGILFKINPLEINFGKRIIKSPKVYFSDTGLACCMLKLNNAKKLISSNHFEALHENFIISLLVKNLMLQGKYDKNKLFYWKESNGHEIKFGIKNPTSFDIFAFSSATNLSKKELGELDYFDEISEGKVLSKSLIYSGFKFETKENLKIIPWTNLID
jgi:hypothetical protein